VSDRHSPWSQPRSLASLATVGLMLLSSCGSFDGHPTGDTSSSGPAGVQAELGGAIGAKLDPESNERLGLLEPGEWVEATLRTDAPQAVAARAKIHGLAVVSTSDTTASVMSDATVVATLIGDPIVQTAGVTEDMRALRPIAADRPAVLVPTPGAPYRDLLLAAQQADHEVPDPLAGAMLAALAQQITTIDGLPYSGLATSDHCEPQPPACWINATGWAPASGGRFDAWSVQARQATGWLVEAGMGQEFGGVPRRLARAAEWVGRMDTTTGPEIEQYDALAGFTWDPERPGRIEVTYLRPCAAASIKLAAVAGNGWIADTGECFDSLTIGVDLATMSVVDHVVRQGP
jgi:hypothetical protein